MGKAYGTPDADHDHEDSSLVVLYEAFHDRSDHPAHGHYVTHQHESQRGQVRGPEHTHYVLCTVDHPELPPTRPTPVSPVSSRRTR